LRCSWRGRRVNALVPSTAHIKRLPYQVCAIQPLSFTVSSIS